MTWNTESVVSGAVNRKKNSDHCHNRKRFTIKSRRPSSRHRVAAGVYRCYSTNTDIRKQVCEDVAPSGTKIVCLSGSGTSVATGWGSQKELSVSAEMPDGKPEQSLDCVRSCCCLSDSGSNDSRLRVSHHIRVKQFPNMNCGDTSTSCQKHFDSTDTKEEKEDLGPDISVIEDPFWCNKTKSRCENIGPPISIFEDLHSPGRAGRSENRVQHYVIDAEISQSENQQRKGGSILWRVFKARRRGSKRNKTKFTLRRRKSTENTEDTAETQAAPELTTQQDARLPTSPVPDSEATLTTPPAQRESDEEPVSVQDINIEFKSDEEAKQSVILDDLLSAHATTPAVSVANTIEDCAETESLGPPVWNYRTRKYRTRKIQVRMRRRPRKILVIGDMSSGKTNLISAYSRDKFSVTYMPTILHCYMTDARICNESIELVVIETSGRDDFEPLRRRAYHKMDAAVICYSVNNVQCFDRIRDFWVPELRKYAPKVPFVLVGTKRDLKDDARDQLEEALRLAKAEDGNSMAARLRAEVSFNEKFISEDRGKRMAQSVGAEGFMECSSLYRDRTRDVFETVTRVALRKSRRVRKDNRHLDTMCTIL